MVTSRIRAKAAGRRRGHLYIEEWMNDRGLSDERMAGRLEVARETVTRYRNEQHRLNPHKIAAIAKALDIEPEELWHPPGPKDRPSLDALVKDMPADAVQKIAELLPFMLKRGANG